MVAPPGRPVGRRARSTLLRVFVLLCCALGLAVGVGIASVGVHFARAHGALLLRGVRVEGLIQEKNIGHAVGRGGGVRHGLVYTFETGAGRVTGGAAVDDDLYRIVRPGDTLRIRYDPEQPENNLPEAEFSFVDWMVMPAFGLFCGVLIAALSGYAALLTLRAARTRRTDRSPH